MFTKKYDDAEWETQENLEMKYNGDEHGDPCEVGYRHGEVYTYRPMPSTPVTYPGAYKHKHLLL